MNTRIFIVHTDTLDFEAHSRIISSAFLLSDTIRRNVCLAIVNKDMCLAINGQSMRKFAPDIHTAEGWIKKAYSGLGGNLGVRIFNSSSCLSPTEELRQYCRIKGEMLVKEVSSINEVSKLLLAINTRKHDVLLFILKERANSISSIWETIVILNMLLDNLYGDRGYKQ